MLYHCQETPEDSAHGPPGTPLDPMRVSDQWSGFPAFREGPPRPKFVKNTRFSFEIASEIIHPPCVLQSSVNAYSCTAAADLRVTSVVPQPQHIASFNQATYSITRNTERDCETSMHTNETTEGGGAAQLHESSAAGRRSRVHLAPLLTNTSARSARSNPLQRVAKFTRRAR